MWDLNEYIIVFNHYSHISTIDQHTIEVTLWYTWPWPSTVRSSQPAAPPVQLNQVPLSWLPPAPRYPLVVRKEMTYYILIITDDIRVIRVIILTKRLSFVNIRLKPAYIYYITWNDYIEWPWIYIYNITGNDYIKCTLNIHILYNIECTWDSCQTWRQM